MYYSVYEFIDWTANIEFHLHIHKRSKNYIVIYFNFISWFLVDFFLISLLARTRHYLDEDKMPYRSENNSGEMSDNTESSEISIILLCLEK